MRRILVWSLLVVVLAGCGAAEGPSATGPAVVGPGAVGSVPATSAADGGGTSSTVAPGPPFAITTTTETLIDTSRITPATDAAPELSSRTLETTVIAPTATGPFPLIVFSHGLTGEPARHTDLASAWARAGYVVAMPAFPLTNASVANANGNVADVANQPGDVSFVIDQVLAESADPASPLHGKVLADRIGVAGHSLGGATTYGVAENDCCRDDRIDAVIVMSGLRLVNTAGDHLGSMPPTMLLHGVADPLLAVAMADEIYPQLRAPKWYVRLLLAGHAEAYENTPSSSDAVVTAATTDFWQAYLAPQAGAPDPAILDRLRRDATVDQISTLQADPG